MKKFIIFLTILSLSSVSFLFSRDITPVISIRYDDLTDGVVVSDAIGLEMDLGNDRFTGFDTDGIDYRIYTGWRFGKIGLGHDGVNPEYTIGATYDIIDNIALDLEFIMADDNSNSMRMGLNINFGVITPIPENWVSKNLF